MPSMSAAAGATFEVITSKVAAMALLSDTASYRVFESNAYDITICVGGGYVMTSLHAYRFQSARFGTWRHAHAVPLDDEQH